MCVCVCARAHLIDQTQSTYMHTYIDTYTHA